MAEEGYVRVGDLRAALDGLDDDILVVMSKDGEGNGFSPLAEVETTNRYVAETTWMGEIFDPNADHDEYYNPGPDAGERCVTLWPTN